MREFSGSYENQADEADVIKAFNSTSRYLDDLLNIDNNYFEQIIYQIYLTEIQLNKSGFNDDAEPLYFVFQFVDIKWYNFLKKKKKKNHDKLDHFDFDINVNFPFFKCWYSSISLVWSLQMWTYCFLLLFFVCFFQGYLLL